jgi:glycosyltransferase involved in cell wall biosynthesis
MTSGEGPPKVTVFMAVYNRADTVRHAIESVLAQTFRDFELLAIDDGSKDASVEIVRSIQDDRIRLVVHETNQGTPRTRNHGLELARGRYLAILDSDDYAYPTRLERQVRYLDENPEVAAVGSWAVGTNRRGQTRRLLVRVTEPRDIRARIPFVSCFKNPTMTARTDVLRRFGYRAEFPICQDIDLWARISSKHALANLPAFLVRYRGGGGSHSDPELTRQMRMRVIRDCLNELGIAYTDEEVALHESLRNTRRLRADRVVLDRVQDWLERLVAANRTARCYPEPEFTEAAAERWLLANLAALRSGTVPYPARSRVLGPHVFDSVATYSRLGARSAVVGAGALGGLRDRSRRRQDLSGMSR